MHTVCHPLLSVMIEMLTNKQAVYEKGTGTTVELQEEFKKKTTFRNRDLAKTWPGLDDDVGNGNDSVTCVTCVTREISNLSIKILKDCSTVSAEDLCTILESILRHLDLSRWVPEDKSKEESEMQTCVSCMKNPIGKLVPNGDKCLDYIPECRHFCIPCMQKSHQNPLYCPLHGYCSPTVGTSTFAVFVAGYDEEIFSKDVDDVVETLSSMHPLVMGLRKENIRIVKQDLNSEHEMFPSKVIEAFSVIHQIIQEKKEKDKVQPFRQEDKIMFLFYFTGHNDREGRWLGNEFLTCEMIKKELSLMDVDHMLLILDCCYAELHDFSSLSKVPVKPNDLQTPELSSKTRKMSQWFSSQHNQKSFAEGNGSIFTRFLLRGLKGKTRKPCLLQSKCELCDDFDKQCDITGCITLVSLNKYIEKHIKGMEAKTKAENKTANCTRPDFRTHGDPVLAYYISEAVPMIQFNLRGVSNSEFLKVHKIEVLPASFDALSLELFNELTKKTDTDCSAYQELQTSDLHIWVQLSGKKIELQSTQDVTKYWQDQFHLEVQVRTDLEFIKHGPVVLLDKKKATSVRLLERLVKTEECKQYFRRDNRKDIYEMEVSEADHIEMLIDGCEVISKMNHNRKSAMKTIIDFMKDFFTRINDGMTTPKKTLLTIETFTRHVRFTATDLEEAS